VKLIVIAVILSALLGSAWKAYALIDQAAYERAELDFREGLAAIKDEAAKQAVEDWKSAQEIAGDATDTEIKIVGKDGLYCRKCDWKPPQDG